MNVVYTICLFCFLLITQFAVSQQDKVAYFSKVEVITKIEDRVIDIAPLAKNCKLRINFKKRTYYFISRKNQGPLNEFHQIFTVVDIIDGKIYAKYFMDDPKDNIIYQVVDGIDKHNKIEFIETVFLDTGQLASRTYSFHN
ncbi:hypothetical protein SCB49_13775 [unidentified eubacterium SCB49]|nr:hypothetical protein SCB49_13775 [unidentified eubacterium SCB49]